MPTFRFTGFQTGQTATLALVQGANTAGPLTIPQWAQPVAGGGTGQLSILARTDNRLVSPTGVWFRAIAGAGFLVQTRARTTDLWNTYDAAFHEIDYQWTITRPAGASASGERDATLNIPNAWKGRNTARGPHTSFVMDVPGAYTVTCTARDWAGNTGTATWTATVLDPAVAFSGNRTICVTPLAPNDPVAPAGAQQFADLDAARAALVALPGEGRMMFKRGEVFNIATSFPTTAAQDQQLINFRCEAFGTGAKPILRAVGERHFYRPSASAVAQEVALVGLRLEGEWDETTETGNAGFGVHVSDCSTHLLVHQCEFSGHDIAINATANSFNFRQGNPLRGSLPTNIVSETLITNWTNMGVFSPDGPPGLTMDAVCCIIHSEIARSPLALVGRFFDRSTSNAHGPVRWSLGDFYTQSSYYFSNAGWSAGGAPAGVSPQPCIRCISSAVDANTNISTGDYFSSLQQIVCEGGKSISFGAADGSGQGHHIPNNALVDGMLSVMTAQLDNNPSLASQGCTTIRNSVFVVPNTRSYGGDSEELITWGPTGNFSNPTFIARNIAQPQRYHNNTFVNLRTAANNGARPNITIFTQDRVDAWNVKVIENNVWHAPNQGAPVTSDGPFTATTIPGFTPRFAGPRMNFPMIDIALPNPLPTVPPGGTIAFPYPPGTSQAHFAANPLGPRSAFVRVITNEANNRFFAHQGEITIAFTPTQIVVTNTSTVTWVQSGTNPYRLSLDRRSELPGPDTSRATPPDLPLLWTPATGSPAIGGAEGGTAGAAARLDVLLRTRSQPRWRGAVQPV